MRRSSSRVVLAVVLPVLFALGCNISDEGGGIEVDCLEDSECPNGRCSNGICIDLSTNNDAGGTNNVITDAGMPDMSMPEDMGTMSDAQPDMEMPLECPDGFIDWNLDASDGCETVAFPGWDIDTCKACAGIPNAIAGCGGGDQCVIADCEDGFYDRDGDVSNGCEATCVVGECWRIASAQLSEIVYVDGPDFWLASAASGLIGRSGTGAQWRYHSSEGPRDYAAAPIGDLYVVDGVIYGARLGKLVRSVDHGRSFGTWDTGPGETLLDINTGADGRYYLLVEEQGCTPRACQGDTECNAGETCTPSGVCGTSACSESRDCSIGEVCNNDGVCTPAPTGCQLCGNSDACIDRTARVYATNDFQTFMPIGPDLPVGVPFDRVHAGRDGFPIVNSFQRRDAYRVSPQTNDWEQIDPRGCDVEFMVFNQANSGVAIGENCSFEYDPIDGRFNNRENIPGKPTFVLFHQDVIYVGGNGFVASSRNLGDRYDDRPINGDVVHMFVDTNGSIVAVGSLGGRWRTVDMGQSWVVDAEPNQPYPVQVETGAPLALVGLDRDGGIVVPSSNGPDEQWLSLPSPRIQRIKQAGGAAFGFGTGGTPLHSSTDWQSLNPMTVNTQTVPTANWPACSGRPCRIANVAGVLDATSDGTELVVIALVNLQFRPSTLIGWQNIGVYPAVLRSPNGVTWDGVQYLGSVPPQFIAAADFGFVTDRGYSNDGSEWFSTGTPECGLGPFFRGSNGDVLGFGDGNVCTTNDGATWQLLTSDFWPVDVPTRAHNVDIRNGAFFVPLDAGSVVGVSASDDGMMWRSHGPRWPIGTDIGFGANGAAAAHVGFFGVSD